MPAIRIVNDPIPSFRFSVEIQGVIVGQFTSCTGLSLEREVKEYAEGGTNDFVYQFPGRVKQQRIQLKRGVTYSHDLYQWFTQGMRHGRVSRKNLSIIVGNAEGKKVQHWDLLSAWPVKYQGPELTAESVAAALELLEIAHHGLILTSDKELPE